MNVAMLGTLPHKQLARASRQAKIDTGACNACEHDYFRHLYRVTRWWFFLLSDGHARSFGISWDMLLLKLPECAAG
jgi:hypothetical protein